MPASRAAAMTFSMSGGAGGGQGLRLCRLGGGADEALVRGPGQHQEPGRLRLHAESVRNAAFRDVDERAGGRRDGFAVLEVECYLLRRGRRMTRRPAGGHAAAWLFPRGRAPRSSRNSPPVCSAVAFIVTSIPEEPERLSLVGAKRVRREGAIHENPPPRQQPWGAAATSIMGRLPPNGRLESGHDGCHFINY